MPSEVSFPATAVWGYAYETAFSFIFPLALFFFFRKRHRGFRFRPLLVGFAAYFAVSLVRGAFRYLILTDSVRQIPAMFYTISALLSGVLEEAGRYLAFRYALDGCDSFQDAVSYGIGHGGMEQMFGTGVLASKFLYRALRCNSIGLSGMIAGMDPERAEAFALELESSADSSLPSSLLMSACWAEGMFLHIALSVLVLAAVVYVGEKKQLWIAMALHTFLDIIPPLIVWSKVPLPMLTNSLIALIPIVYAYKVWKRIRRKEIQNGFKNDAPRRDLQSGGKL